MCINQATQTRGYRSRSVKCIMMSMRKAKVIGVTSRIDFVRYKNFKQIPARIDTGARTSSLWASKIVANQDKVTFSLFGPESEFYTGNRITLPSEGLCSVVNSTGHVQVRHSVRMVVRINGRKLNAKFTLSNRSTQSYPILIGRNTLRGNFLIDSGDPGDGIDYAKDPSEENEFNENEAV